MAIDGNIEPAATASTAHGANDAAAEHGHTGSKSEKIIRAAIMSRAGRPCHLPQPARHHDVIARMAKDGEPTPVNGQQGFMTSEGRFVGREEARKIAEAAGQLIASYSTPGGVPIVRDHPQLFSEDVW